MRKWWLIFAIILISADAFAVGSGGEAGGEAGAFLKDGTSARAIALGGAYVSLADDSGAAYWNPAGLMQIPRIEATAIHSQPFGELEDISYNVVNYTQRLRDVAFGVSIVSISVGGIQRVEGVEEEIINPDFTFPTFASREVASLLSCAKPLTKRTFVGATLKYIYQELDESKDSGVGLDLGVLHLAMKGVRVGFVIQNLLGAEIREDVMPLTLRLGASYKLWERVILTADFETIIGRDLDEYLEERAGVEFEITEALRLRFGYSSEGFASGAGFRVHRFGLDYAYKAHHDLGSTHFASLSIMF